MTQPRRNPLDIVADVTLASDATAPAIAADLRYDYSQVADEYRDAVKQAAVEIKRREKRAATDMIEIGKMLLDVRGRLEHGQFLPWIETEFGWQKTIAYSMMDVAEKLPKFGNLENYGLSALYRLSAPSVPDAAIEQANQVAAKGEKVTHRVAKAIVDAHKPPKPSPADLVAQSGARSAAYSPAIAQDAPTPHQAAQDAFGERDGVIVPDQPETPVFPTVTAATDAKPTPAQRKPWHGQDDDMRLWLNRLEDAAGTLAEIEEAATQAGRMMLADAASETRTALYGIMSRLEAGG